MISRRTTMASLAFALVLGIAPATAQQEQSREELERRLRELREEMRDLERRLWEGQGSGWHVAAPRVMAFSSNRARLGVSVQMRADDETDDIGAALQSVVEDGPAWKAGLRAGDIITSFNGEPLTGRYPAAGRNESEPARKLVDLVGELHEGDEVVLVYQRDGRSTTATATLEVVEPEWFGLGPSTIDVRMMRPDDVTLPLTGVRVRRGSGVVVGDGGGFITITEGVWSDIELVALDSELGRYFGVASGLLIIRAPEEINQLQAGDVILSIGGREADTPSRALRILRSYDEGEQIEMQIMRDQRRQTVTITVPERHNDFFYERRF